MYTYIYVCMHTLAYICSHTYMNYTHVHIHIGHNRYMYIFLPIQEKCNVSLHCTQGGICLGVCMQCICTYIHVCALCVRTLILQHIRFEWRVYTYNTMWYVYTYNIRTHKFYYMYLHTTKRFSATLAILCMHTPHLHKQTLTLLYTSVYINTCTLHKYSHILSHVYIYIYTCANTCAYQYA